MRRISLHRSLPMLILLGLLLVTVQGRAQSAESIGRVTAIEGQVTQLRQGRFATELLTLQKPVFQEDIIETGAASKVQLTLTDSTVISLGERSRLELTQFLYNPRQQTQSVRFSIPVGFFRAIVNKLLPQSTFDVITPTAVAAIRGTDLMGEVTAEATMIVVLEGTVTISNARQRFRGIATLTEGMGTTVSDDQSPTGPTRWSETRIEALRRATTVR